MFRGNERIVIGSTNKDDIFSIHHSDLEAFEKWKSDLDNANKRIKELENKLEVIKRVIM